MRHFVLYIVLIISLSLTACSGNSDTNPKSEPTQAAPSPPPANAEPALPLSAAGEQLIATVNGQGITLTEFQHAFNLNQPVSDIASYDALAAVKLNELISQRLMNQAAEEMGIVVTDTDVDAEYAVNRALVSDDTQWQAWLTANGFTEETFRQSLYDSIMTQRLQQAIIGDNSTIVQAHARHIQVATIEEAQVILNRLNTGEDFATLATELSTDPTTNIRGGDLGWFVRSDLLQSDFADFIMGLEPGQTDGPFKTPTGYQVVQLIELGQRPTSPEEKAKLDQEQFNAWIQSLHDNATIETFMN